MARHNREARGVDQRGELWIIGYQPDWLSRVKISRKLPRGRRRSRLTIFRNPSRQAQAKPGKVVRTRIAAADGSAEFTVALEDRKGVVESIIVTTRRGKQQKERVDFVLQGRMPPPTPR